MSVAIHPQIETIANPCFQTWVAKQSASGYDVFKGMNPIKEGSYTRKKADRYEEPWDLGDSQREVELHCGLGGSEARSIQKNVRRHLSRSSDSRNEGLLRRSAQVSQELKQSSLKCIPSIGLGISPRGTPSGIPTYVKDGGHLAFPSQVRWLPINHLLIK
jgi:hypothetical protein